MMYAKLIARNIRRSTKEYAIYIMTLVIAIMLMYAFNGMAFSKEVQNLSRTMDALMGMVVGASIVIVLVLGWLIYYISNFIMQKRSREFGMYMLMGMRRNEISRMFLLEQICMGLMAFIIGCILGIFVYQVIEAIIMELFQKQYQFKVSFSYQAAGVTLLYFAGIYLLELLRERLYLRKQKIHDLLYNERKNERAKNSRLLSAVLFLMGILFFLLGLQQLNASFTSTEDVGLPLIIGILCTMLSIFMIYFSLSYVITGFINRRKKIKYHGNMLYLSAQLGTRLRTSRMVLALLTILTLSTFLLVCVGLKFNEGQRMSERLMPFEIYANGQQEIDESPITDYMKEHDIAYTDLKFELYNLPFHPFERVKGTQMERVYKNSDDDFNFLRYSDYVKLLKMQGEKPLKMKDDEYILMVSQEENDVITDCFKDYSLNDLDYLTSDDRELGQTRYDFFWFVVPDSFVDSYAHKNHNYGYTYVLNSTTPSSREWDVIEKELYEKNMYLVYFTRYDWMTTNLSSTMILVFSLIYLAIILTCVSATVLAIQQMSDAWKQRKSYHMLWNMGYDRRQIHRLLQKQIALYFFVPYLVAAIYIFPIVQILNKLFAMSYARASMIPYVCFAMLFYLAIDIIYYLVAYFSCKRSIGIETR